MIAHVVLFTPKNGLSNTEKRSLARTVVETISSIEFVASWKIGKSIDIEPGYFRNMGDATYEFVAVLEFMDRNALVSYLRDPRHEALGRLFWASCERTTVTEVEYVDVQSADAVDVLVK